MVRVFPKSHYVCKNNRRVLIRERSDSTNGKYIEFIHKFQRDKFCLAMILPL
jgi:hypothetical protein